MAQERETMTAADARVRALRRRVESTRDDLDRYVSELGRRREEAMDLKLQARRHPAAAAAIALGVAGLVAGGAYAAVRAARRRKVRTIAVRLSDAVRALGSDERPRERRAAAPSPAAIASRFVGSLAPALGAVVTRQAAGFLRQRLTGRRRA